MDIKFYCKKFFFHIVNEKNRVVFRFIRNKTGLFFQQNKVQTGFNKIVIDKLKDVDQK